VDHCCCDHQELAEECRAICAALPDADGVLRAERVLADARAIEQSQAPPRPIASASAPLGLRLRLRLRLRKRDLHVRSRLRADQCGRTR
jgi:hypothetical protein